VLPLPVTRLVKLHFSGFAVKLHVLRLLLADHDGIHEVDVNEDDEFVCAWLEEEMLDVAEQDVHVRVACTVYVA